MNHQTDIYKDKDMQPREKIAKELDELSKQFQDRWLDGDDSDRANIIPLRLQIADLFLEKLAGARQIGFSEGFDAGKGQLIRRSNHK